MSIGCRDLGSNLKAALKSFHKSLFNNRKRVVFQSPTIHGLTYNWAGNCEESNFGTIIIQKRITKVTSQTHYRSLFRSFGASVFHFKRNQTSCNYLKIVRPLEFKSFALYKSLGSYFRHFLPIALVL